MNYVIVKIQVMISWLYRQKVSTYVWLPSSSQGHMAIFFACIKRMSLPCSIY